MSELSPLSGVKRKSDFGAVRAAFDPRRTFGSSRLAPQHGWIVGGEIFRSWGFQLTSNRVERRLAAIVAADVAGFSRLMGLDEVGTAHTLREHRAASDALVTKHGGRIVKTTGDGMLLEFPSVVDAVECAVAVQAVMAERNDAIPQDRRMGRSDRRGAGPAEQGVHTKAILFGGTTVTTGQICMSAAR
jgi:class 3 adenylate cyclase